MSETGPWEGIVQLAELPRHGGALHKPPLSEAQIDLLGARVFPRSLGFKHFLHDGEPCTLQVVPAYQFNSAQRKREFRSYVEDEIPLLLTGRAFDPTPATIGGKIISFIELLEARDAAEKARAYRTPIELENSGVWPRMSDAEGQA